MALLDNLISYWTLNEASGTRNDSHGTNHLTDNNSVTSAAGKLGDAALFASASSEYLNRADNADLSTGDIDFTIAAWVYVGDKSAVRGLLARVDAGWTVEEYSLYYDSSSDRFIWQVNGTNNVAANNLGSPSVDTWYHIVAWHDAVNNQIGIVVNAGSADTASYAGGISDLAVDLYVGRVGSNYMEGRIDSASFWKRVLTSQERSDLYNSGNGLEYPFSSSVQHRLALLGVGA